MITFLIVSIFLAASAPFMTKTQKNSLPSQPVVNRVAIPAGAIMFFEGDCPDDDWTDLSGQYAGRYIKIAGNYNICDKNGENPNGICVGSSTPAVANSTDGTRFQGETIRRISGMFPGGDADVYPRASLGATSNMSEQRELYVSVLKDINVLSGVFDYLTLEEVNNGHFTLKPGWTTYKYPGFSVNAYGVTNNNGYISYYDPGFLTMTGADEASWFVTTFDTANVVPSGSETQPKTVVLKACKKN